MIGSRAILSAAVRCAALLPLVDGAVTGHEQKPLDSAKVGGNGSADKNPFTPDLNAFVKSVMDQWHVPGMSIAVVDGDDTFAKGFGLARLPDTPATPETLYYVGSTTKAHTAAVLAHLIDLKTYPELARGWKTPISSIIHDDFVLQDEWATLHITLDDAVSHRTGLTRHDNSWHREINGKQATLKDTVRNLRNLPLSVEPRTEWYYCNFMFVTLSHVIETLTGRWLGDVLKEVIWKPLGMNTTYLDLEDAQNSSAPLAASYAWRDAEQKYEELPYLPTKEISGAGAMISNVLDYVKWIKCLLDETKPFSKAVHEDIRTPRFPQSRKPGLGIDVTLYGLAWFRTIIHGQIVYYHSGSTFSFGAQVYWLPSSKFGVVTFGNGAMVSSEVGLILARKIIEERLQVPADDRPDINKVLKELTEARARNIERADDILWPERPEHPAPPSIPSAQLTGTYFHEGYGTVKLFEEPLSADSDQKVLVANRTELTWSQQWRLHHVSGDYWTLYDKTLLGINEVTSFYAAEFAIGVDGKAVGFAVIIYDVDAQVNEGTILFRKVEEA